MNLKNGDNMFSLPSFDSHCHLQDKLFDNDREKVIEVALSVLDGVITIGDSLDSSLSALRLVRDRLFVTIGIHPYYARDVNSKTVALMKEWSLCKGVVGIGETGFDLSFHSKCPIDVQRKAFLRHVELALERQLPIVIHCRDATQEMISFLKECSNFPSGVMHCFQGDFELLDACLNRDLYISFAGNITFPKAELLRTAAQRVPLDRLLVETDSPYLAPQPVRGKRCEPCHLNHTVAYLAELLGVSPEDLAEKTSRNARRLFRIP